LLAQGKYDAAHTSLQAAKQLLPTDEVQQLLKQVEQQMAQAPAAHPNTDSQRRATAATTLPPRMDPPTVPTRKPDPAHEKPPARTTLADHQSEQTLKSIREPLRLAPPTPSVTQGQRPATGAQEMARTPTPQAKPQPQPATPVPAVSKEQTEYNRQMQFGAAWEKQQNYDAAIKAYTEALRLKPRDRDATLAYYLADGRKALKARRFPDATRDFETVLRFAPSNADAKKLLQQAQQGKP
jgi:tetratricopeptide (TPR) repeat protein